MFQILVTFTSSRTNISSTFGQFCDYTFFSQEPNCFPRIEFLLENYINVREANFCSRTEYLLESNKLLSNVLFNTWDVQYSMFYRIWNLLHKEANWHLMDFVTIHLKTRENKMSSILIMVHSHSVYTLIKVHFNSNINEIIKKKMLKPKIGKLRDYTDIKVSLQANPSCV